jgi:uncharacterized membrane protein (UPF0127 family)
MIFNDNKAIFHHRVFLITSVFFLLLLPFFAGCENQTKKLSTQELTIIKADNSSINLIAEIAKTDEERAQGFMYRKEVKAGEGMLFVFDRDQIMNFWMKNTFVPLSIAYISSDGIILEIHDLTPHREAPVSSSRSARYALEVPQGWFETENVQIGDRLSNESF